MQQSGNHTWYPDKQAKLTLRRCLKEQCHEDFPLSGQFWAKIITLKLKSWTKCFCKATTKISNEFYQRGLTTINFLRIFGTRGIKTWKNWPIFSSFNPFPSMPSVATGDRKQSQYLQIVFNNTTRSLVLEFNWCEDTF